MSNNTEKKFLTSFDKSYSSHIFFKRPDKYREIERQTKNSENLITSGSNYSYAPIGFEKNTLSIDFSSFNRILDFNPVKQEITVEAGLTILELLKFTLVHNMWLPQIPGYPFISLGGIVATNSHGKSCDTYGTIRRAIKKIKLFHKTHGWLNLSENENKEIFELTIGGLGLTGTIVSITFQLEKFEDISFYTDIEKVSSFKDCLKKISNSKGEPNLVYSWNRADDLKNFGKGYIFRNKMIKKKSTRKNSLEKIKKKKFKFPVKLWNKLSLNIVNNCFYKFQDMKKQSFEEDFVKVIDLILKSNSRLVITGIGKSALIGMKITATLNSTGTQSIFMHAADAIHGDLGMVAKEDIVLFISKSGNTPEIKALVPLVKFMGNNIIGITGNPSSFLAQESNYVLSVAIQKEACPNNLGESHLYHRAHWHEGKLYYRGKVLIDSTTETA